MGGNAPGWRLLGAFVGLLTVGNVLGAEVPAEFPRKPIKVIVPFAAGGGSDTFVRILAEAIRESQVSPQPFTVVNVPGAGGVIGSRRVRYAPADGYTLLNLHEAILTAKYSGKVNYGPEAFDPVAGTGRVDMVLAVPESSPHTDLPALAGALEANPDSLRFAANLGAPSHFAGLLLEAETRGGAFRYVQVGGGAKRFASLVGGHADVTVFSIAEFLGFREGGLRGLAVLSPKRSEALPQVPTAIELGLDVQFTNMQFWWLPKGTSIARRDAIASILTDVMAQEAVRDRLAALHTDPIVVTGQALDELLASKERAMASLGVRKTVDVPRFGPALVGMLALLSLIWGVSEWRHGSGRRFRAFGAMGSHPRAVGGLASILLYVICLDLSLLPFAWATWGFVLLFGNSVSVLNWQRCIGLLVLGGLLGFGGTWVFGTVLQVDLP